jgi:RNA polymerase sigma-70 factor (ECF subfamily)
MRMLSKSPANCRQIFHRARQALQNRRARVVAEPQRQRQLVLSFLSASQAGDMATLTSLLTRDAVSWSDGGGKVRANLKSVSGQQAVARFWSFWLGQSRADQPPLTFSLAEINGGPAIPGWQDHQLVVVISLLLSAEGIEEIDAVPDPDKLAYLQKQLAGLS